LKNCPNPIGEENDFHIEKLSKEADMLILAWGNYSEKHRLRVKDALKILKKTNKQFYALKITKKGNPHHPARLKFEKIVPYPLKN